MVDDEPFALNHCLLVGRVNLYPQAKQRKETALAEKVADLGRFGGMPSPILNAEATRHAGIPVKKKGPEKFRALAYGGGGGNRTRVRKSATSSSTCVVRSIEFSRGAPAEQARFRRFTKFSSRTP